MIVLSTETGSLYQIGQGHKAHYTITHKLREKAWANLKKFSEIPEAHVRSNRTPCQDARLDPVQIRPLNLGRGVAQLGRATRRGIWPVSKEKWTRLCEDSGSTKLSQ